MSRTEKFPHPAVKFKAGEEKRIVQKSLYCNEDSDPCIIKAIHFKPTRLVTISEGTCYKVQNLWAVVSRTLSNHPIKLEEMQHTHPVVLKYVDHGAAESVEGTDHPDERRVQILVC